MLKKLIDDFAKEIVANAQHGRDEAGNLIRNTLPASLERLAHEMLRGILMVIGRKAQLDIQKKLTDFKTAHPETNPHEIDKLIADINEVLNNTYKKGGQNDAANSTTSTTA